ncbi:MAG: hypothetical protein K2X81_04200 [Candidatus Obscuribacterales bacterium]|jgi:hypothetical protein|nr:hypothetical protein [Candidatus Obscuribacterales bacterium]
MEDKQNFRLLKGGHYDVSFLKPNKTVDITSGGDNIWLDLGFSIEEAQTLEKEYLLVNKIQECLEQILEQSLDGKDNSKLSPSTAKNRAIKLLAKHLDRKPSFVRKLLKGRKSELSLNELSALLFKLRGFRCSDYLKETGGNLP